MKVTKHSKREAKELFRACLVNGVLDERRAREVVDKIAAEKPRDYLGLLYHFRRLVQLDAHRHAARIESAQPLPPDLQSAVKASLERIYGESLNALFTENPALIGGMRIQVGSDVYDGSVRARLAVLAKSF